MHAAGAALQAMHAQGVRDYDPADKLPGTGGSSRGRVRYHLTNARNIDEILSLVETHAGSLQPDHFACAWNKLAHMSREERTGSAPLSLADERIARLLHLLYQSLTTTAPSAAAVTPSAVGAPLPSWGGRELANVAHGVCVVLGLPASGDREVGRARCSHRRHRGLPPAPGPRPPAPRP